MTTYSDHAPIVPTREGFLWGPPGSPPALTCDDVVEGCPATILTRARNEEDGEMDDVLQPATVLDVIHDPLFPSVILAVQARNETDGRTSWFRRTAVTSSWAGAQERFADVLTIVLHDVRVRIEDMRAAILSKDVAKRSLCNEPSVRLYIGVRLDEVQR